MKRISELDVVSATNNSDELVINSSGITKKISLENLMSKLQSQINALSSKVDSFTHLAEGSTTGDAELIAARTDYNGTKHDSLGTAINSVTSALSARIDELSTLINNAGDDIENISKSIADPYSIERTYKVDDFCTHDNRLYKCAVAIATPETWTAGHWVEATVFDYVVKAVSEMSSITDTIEELESVIDELSTSVSTNGTDITTLKAEIEDAHKSFDGVNYTSLGEAIREQVSTLNLNKIDGAYVEDGYLTLTAGEDIVVDKLGPFSGGGGGGGGAANNAKLTATNTSGWLYKSIATDSDLNATIEWSSIEDEMPTGNGTLRVTVNGVLRLSQNIQQGEITINLGAICGSGSNKVKVVISDVYDNSRTINFTINCIELKLTSSFDANAIYSGDVYFPYTPTGNVAKTVHFILDDKEVSTKIVNISNTQVTEKLPSMSHGPHTLRVYFEADINGELTRSNELYYEITYSSDGTDRTIITSSFNRTTVEQYESVVIPYKVTTPDSYTSVVIIRENNTVVNTLTVDRNEQTHTYRAQTPGNVTITFSSGGVSKTISFTVTQSDINPVAETELMSLYLSAYGRSNNEAEPLKWVYGSGAAAIRCTFSNFNLTNDCWQLDDDGVTVLRVTGDARLTIPYKLFANDFRSTGKTIEIEFATRDIRNYDANIISCMNNNRGFSLTAQRAVLRSEQTEISTQYKEDEHVRIAFVIEKQSEHRLVYIYINGIMSGAVQYPQNDDFSQLVPQDISVGSSDCTIDIYCIRVYDNDLSRSQIVNNWIADTQVGELMVARYKRNDVFDEYGQIVISKLPVDLPYMILDAPVLPQYKDDKKTISGSFVDSVSTSRSFTFEGAQADVQGTSSQYYPRKNYKIKFKGGFDINGRHADDFAMNSTAIPTNTFTFKADFASSEGANNVELVRLYNEACPYKTPPQRTDSRVRQGIDGFPIVIFQNDGTNTTFIGKYNFNNDKGTEEVFGFAEGDESWEIKNNTGNRVIWKDDHYGVAYTDDKGVHHDADEWLNDFEGRYPDGNEDPTNLSALAKWLKTTDTEEATNTVFSTPVDFGETEKIITTGSDGNDIITYRSITHDKDDAAYRLAKFKAELPDHMEVDAVLFYYLFTELFLMVDNRAKNAFPTFMGGDKWFSLPYDMDTAIGINNEGALVFDYALEDIDHTESGANVYNGQDSVLWKNVRNAFYDELTSMYQELRSQGALSYEKVENMFETHQSKWPEALFNEDSYFKYIQPFVENGENYLDMLQGAKAEQRKWWLYNRFRYIDSKYNAGDALSDVITIRAYAKGNITVTPYADIYPTIKYGSYIVHERGKRNTSTTLICPLTDFNDTEVYIYSASQLASIGDISGLKPGLINIAAATKLQELKVGDASSSYSNGNLTSLTMGNNVLLKKIDVRNCPNLTMAIDMRGCTNVEEVYFEGTNITSIDLPNGGVLRTLHLPASVTNLTILNQTAIQDFVLPSYDNLTTVRLENVSSVIDPINILHNIQANSRVRIIGFHIDVDSVEEIAEFCDYLGTMKGLDEQGQNVETAQVQGTMHVPFITGEVLARYKEDYPNITITYDHITSKLYYYSYDGSELLHTEDIADGGNAVGWNGAPARESTAQYDYTFDGWSTKKNATRRDADALKAITTDRNVYAAYSTTTRQYPVTFVNTDGTVLQEAKMTNYGSTATYTGQTPVSPRGNNFVFSGWSPSNSNIKGETTCIAYYYDSSSDVVKYLRRSLETYSSTSTTPLRQYAFNYQTSLTEVTTATSKIAYQAFDDTRMLEKVDLTNTSGVNIGNYAFDGSKLRDLIIRSSTIATLDSIDYYFYHFYGTELSTGAGAVYVPSNIIDEYRNNQYWRMVPIHEINKYPIEDDYSTITDSWETIFANEANGTYKTKYRIGDTKRINMNGNNIYMQIIAFDTDALASGTGTAPITWLAMASFESVAWGNTLSGGWRNSELRSRLQSVIFPTLDEAIKNNIKTVTKPYRIGSTTYTTSDTLWVPSIREFYGDVTPAEDSGVIYSDFAPNRYYFARSKIGSRYPSSYYLRTISNTSTSYYYSDTNGNYYTSMDPLTTRTVIIGMCT